MQDLLLVLDLGQSERIQFLTDSMAHNTLETNQCPTKLNTKIKYNHSKNFKAVLSIVNILTVSELKKSG
jgi:hypothetical protein